MTTVLTYHAADADLAWHNLVVEVPHYLPRHAHLPHSILAVASALNRLAGLSLDLSDLRRPLA